jgi:hypothetical protein
MTVEITPVAWADQGLTAPAACDHRYRSCLGYDFRARDFSLHAQAVTSVERLTNDALVIISPLDFTHRRTRGNHSTRRIKCSRGTSTGGAFLDITSATIQTIFRRGSCYRSKAVCLTYTHPFHKLVMLTHAHPERPAIAEVPVRRFELGRYPTNLPLVVSSECAFA